MNKVFLIGRLTKDIDIKEKGNLKIGKFTIAVNRTYKNKDGNYESDFLNCILFNVNDYLGNNLKKGTEIGIDGSIQTNSYEVSGEKRYSTDIIVNKIEILSKKVGGTQQVLDNSHIKTEVQQQFEYSEEDYPF